MTVYKPIRDEAEAAARLAAAVAEGELSGGDDLAMGNTHDSVSGRDVKSVLLGADLITRDNLRQVAVSENAIRAADLCAGDVAAACAELFMLCPCHSWLCEADNPDPALSSTGLSARPNGCCPLGLEWPGSCGDGRCQPWIISAMRSISFGSSVVGLKISSSAPSAANDCTVWRTSSALPVTFPAIRSATSLPETL
jgi:hypothetical protein